MNLNLNVALIDVDGICASIENRQKEEENIRATDCPMPIAHSIVGECALRASHRKSVVVQFVSLLPHASNVFITILETNVSSLMYCVRCLLLLSVFHSRADIWPNRR